MARLVYSMIVSLDGYVEDADGTFDFAAPAADTHQKFNDQTRRAAAFLHGRRMYQTMEEPWVEAAARDDLPEVEAEFARLYTAIPRVVFSDSLTEVAEGVRLVRRPESVAEITRLKQESDGDLLIGGADLAGSVIDLIDEFRPVIVPWAVGGGKPFFPKGVRVQLRLIEQTAFESGTVFLRYEHVR